MADQREVIKEFLASLGFQIDAPSARRFLDTLGATGGAAGKVGKIIAGVAIAAEGMVDVFAFSMEKLYYASRRTNASVENLQAASFGFRQIGLAGEGAIDVLEAMASVTRMNPGLRGLLDSLLGKKTEGMDQMRVMMKLVERLSAMPHFVGAQFAQMFGMDERTFFMMKDQLPRLVAAEEKRRQMNRDAGIDASAAAAASREYANSLGEIWEKTKVLSSQIAIALLPLFRKFNALVSGTLDNLIRFRWEDFAKAFVESPQIKSLIEIWDFMSSVAARLAALPGAGTVVEGAGKGAALMSGPSPMMALTSMLFPGAGEPAAHLGATASIAVSIDQKTDIHVAGAGDPAAVARDIGAAQSRVNGDLVRNLSGAIR